MGQHGRLIVPALFATMKTAFRLCFGQFFLHLAANIPSFYKSLTMGNLSLTVMNQRSIS